MNLHLTTDSHGTDTYSSRGVRDVHTADLFLALADRKRAVSVSQGYDEIPVPAHAQPRHSGGV